MITIHDLRTPDQPAVIDALTRKCTICTAPINEFCRPIRLGGKLTTLVHMARATKDERRPKK